MAICNAISKYGINNFTLYILESFDSSLPFGRPQSLKETKVKISAVNAQLCGTEPNHTDLDSKGSINNLPCSPVAGSEREFLSMREEF
jgi:hypothetical protein